MHGQAATWDSLGYAHQHVGDHGEAASCYRQAIDIYRTLGDRKSEADTLTRLGDNQTEVDDPDAAREAWQRALAILDDLGHPEAEGVCAKLRSLAAAP